MSSSAVKLYSPRSTQLGAIRKSSPTPAMGPTTSCMRFAATEALIGCSLTKKWKVLNVIDRKLSHRASGDSEGWADKP